MSKPFVTNASDPVQVKEAARKARFQEKAEVGDLRWVLSTREGRRFLSRLMKLCGLDNHCINTSGSLTYTELGQRNVALSLKAEIKAIGLDHWQLMEREDAETERKDP